MGAQIISLMGVASMVCLLIAAIVLLNLIQRAFASDGLIWGFITIVYPPGTYLYCRKNWDMYRSHFLLISVLLLAALVLWALVKLF